MKRIESREADSSMLDGNHITIVTMKLHDLHNDYPLAPENKVITFDKYSRYQKYIAEKLNHPLTERSKLIPNLEDKKIYVLHGKNIS